MASSAKPDALFDPGMPENAPPSFLGYSKGYDSPLEAVGSALKGAGNVIAGGIEALYNNTVRTIEKEATEAIDARRDQEIEYLQGAKGYGKRLLGVVPPHLNDQLKRVDTMSSAYKQGLIPPSHYEGLLDLEARKLRSQYPGFRDEIDRVFSKQVGHIPANALVSKLRAEATAAGGAKDALHKKEEDWARENNPDISALRQKYGADIPTEELLKSNAPYQAAKSTYEFEKRKLDLTDAQLTERHKTADELAGRRLSFVTSSMLAGETAAFQELAAKNNIDLNKIDAIGPKQQAQVAQFGARVKQNAAKLFQETMYTPSPDTGKTLASSMKPEDIEKRRKEIMASVDQFLGFYTDANFGMANIHKNANEMVVQGAMSDALKNEVVRGNAALSKLNGGDWVKMVMQNDSQMYKRTTDAARDVVLGKLGTGSTEPLAEYWKTIEDITKKTGGSVEEASRRAFDLTMRAVTDPKTPADVRETAARQLFGAKDFYSHFPASDETKNAIFAKMTSPQVTAVMQGLRDEGKEDIWGMYANFVEKSFQDRIDKRGADLKGLTEAKDGKSTLVYDPKTLMFQRVDRPASSKKELPTPTQFQAEDIRNQQLNKTQAELNLSIRNYAQYLKTQGMSPEQINAAVTMAFASRSGVDINDLGSPEEKVKREIDAQKKSDVSKADDSSYVSDTQAGRYTKIIQAIRENGGLKITERESDMVEDRRGVKEGPVVEAMQSFAGLSSKQLLGVAEATYDEYMLASKDKQLSGKAETMDEIINGLNQLRVITNLREAAEIQEAIEDEQRKDQRQRNRDELTALVTSQEALLKNKQEKGTSKIATKR